MDEAGVHRHGMSAEWLTWHYFFSPHSIIPHQFFLPVAHKLNETLPKMSGSFLMQLLAEHPAPIITITTDNARSHHSAPPQRVPRSRRQTRLLRSSKSRWQSNSHRKNGSSPCRRPERRPSKDHQDTVARAPGSHKVSLGPVAA